MPENFVFLAYHLMDHETQKVIPKKLEAVKLIMSAPVASTEWK